MIRQFIQHPYMRKLLLTSLILFLLTSQSCTSLSDDRLNIAKAEIESQIEGQSKGNMQLQSLEKIDGKEFTGEDYQYGLDVKGKMLIIHDCNWPVGHSLLRNYGKLFYTFELTDKKEASGIADDGTILMTESKTNFHQGNVVEFNGTVYFEKKESGWKVYKVDLKE